jgi:hypothetical protein
MSYLPRLSKIENINRLMEKLHNHHYFVIAPSNFSCPYTNRAIELLDDNGCNVIAIAVDHLLGNQSIPPYKTHPILREKGAGSVKGVPSTVSNTYPRIIHYDSNRNEYRWIGGSEDLRNFLEKRMGGILVGENISCDSGCKG